jgi:hypothetical protein
MIFIDVDSKVKTSSTFERNNYSYGRSSFKKRSSKSKHNYHSNSFENLNINDSDNEFKS